MVHYDDEERPARTLAERVGLGVTVIAFAAALRVLGQESGPLAEEAKPTSASARDGAGGGECQGRR